MIKTTKTLTVLLVLCLMASLLPAAFASSGHVTISTSDEMTAGVEPGSITLTAEGGTFNADPASNLFSFNGAGVGTLAVTRVSAVDNSTTATVYLSGAPSEAGQITLRAESDVFKTGNPESTTPVRITVKAPTVTVTASGNLTAGVADGTITLTSVGSPFVSSLQNDWFTFGGTAGTGLKIKSVGGGGTNDVTLTMEAPTATGDATVTIAKDAFLYQPDNEVIASGTVNVAVPSGTVNAALNGTLTAGTDATGTTITLTATDTLVFSELPDPDNFTLNADSSGLKLKGLERGGDGKTMTLTLEGTPDAAGSFTITVKQAAFTYSPGDDVTTNSITINYPTVTLTPEPSTIAEGFHGSITLTVDGSLFNAASGTTNFSISGTGSTGLNLDSVAADAGGKTAVLTLSGEPTATGDLTITVNPAAFKYQPASDVTATVKVEVPTGNVTAALNGTLTVNTEATGATITLTADGTLVFADAPATDAFTLGAGSADLKVSGVTRNGDKSVTLALSGVPTTVGSFTVTVKTTAFKYAPANDIPASPDIPISYPVITLTPDPAQFTVGQTTQVKLTAKGGVFVESPDASLFTISGDGYTGLTVTKVELSGDKTAVTLTLSGPPAKAGSLILTVKKEAFQNQPENPVSLTIPVVAPAAKPTSTPAGTAPNTGDGSPLILWTGVLAVCLSGLAAVLAAKRKKHSR